MSNMESMLREAMESRRSKVSVALTDLNNIVVEMSEAVAAVSNGEAKLVLQKLRSTQENPVYALLFISEDDETQIRIFSFSELGYPITCSESGSPRGIAQGKKLMSAAELRSILSPLLSDPASKLVRLIEYISLPEEVRTEEVEIPF